jgi:hypothetical protein
LRCPFVTINCFCTYTFCGFVGWRIPHGPSDLTHKTWPTQAEAWAKLSRPFRPTHRVFPAFVPGVVGAAAIASIAGAIALSRVVGVVSVVGVPGAAGAAGAAGVVGALGVNSVLDSIARWRGHRRSLLGRVNAPARPPGKNESNTHQQRGQ